MLKLRLNSIGKKKKKFFRIILIDSKKKQNGKWIKKIGFYDPIKKIGTFDSITIKKSFLLGAQINSTLLSLLLKHNVL